MGGKAFVPSESFRVQLSVATTNSGPALDRRHHGAERWRLMERTTVEGSVLY